MGKQSNKFRKVFKGTAGNLHGHMLAVQNNAMLIIVGIRGILQKPLPAAKIQGYQAMRLAGRVTGMTGKALILPAQQALRIAGGLHQLCLGNITGILFRLGKINRNIQIAILGSRLPDNIFVNTRLSYIVRSNTQLIIVIRSQLRRPVIICPESPDYLRRPWHHAVHQQRIKQITLVGSILNDSLLRSIIQHPAQDLIRHLQPLIYLLRTKLLQLQGSQQKVCPINLISLVK